MQGNRPWQNESEEEKAYIDIHNTKLSHRLHKNDKVKDISSSEERETNEDEQQLMVVATAALEAVPTSPCNADIMVEKDL